MKLRRTRQTEKGKFFFKKYGLFTLENTFRRKKSMDKGREEKVELRKVNGSRVCVM